MSETPVPEANDHGKRRQRDEEPVSEKTVSMAQERPRSGAFRIRRMVTMGLGGVAVLAGIIWAVQRLHYSQTHVSTDNAQVDAHIVPVLAKVGGYVSQVLVEDNQSVTRGDPVVVLDDADLQVRLAEAEADLAAARASAGGDGIQGQVEAEASASQARRQALEARLSSARARRTQAQKDLERVKDLAAKKIASRQQLDAAETAATAAEAEVSALEREVAAARAAEVSAQAATRGAEARLARAQASVKKARLDVAYARVTSPSSGVISRTQVEVGQLVQPGQPLAAVVADSAIWVTANLKETEMADVQEGQDVVLDVDAYPGCDAAGVVESLSPATGSKFALLPPDNATGNFTKVVQRVPVRIAITGGCGEARPLRPGMSVVAHIHTR
jgi:membrane fusion protein (multidrug efflux system)